MITVPEWFMVGVVVWLVLITGVLGLYIYAVRSLANELYKEDE